MQIVGLADVAPANDIIHMNINKVVQAPRVGLELGHVSKNPSKDLCKSPDSSAAQSGAIPSNFDASSDTSNSGMVGSPNPDLALIISRWPTLSSDIKKQILSLLSGATQDDP
ncbi:MAG TPA: hypothetical protein VMJ32_09770 [Pirellulales bacterium]|nr:hypothetical protein [Pirellulales bacterium]